MDHDNLLQKKTKAEIFEIIDSAVTIAASRWPQDFLARRNLILKKLYAASKETSDDCVSTTSSFGSSRCPVPAKEADSNEEVPATTSDDNKKPRFIVRLKLAPAKRDLASREADKNDEAPANTSDSDKKARSNLEDAKDQSKKPPLSVQETTACREVHQAKEAQESAVPVNVVQEDSLVQQPKSVQEDLFRKKLEASKRKLHEGYKKFQDSRKRIRVVELADAPKPTADPKNPRIRYVR